MKKLIEIKQENLIECDHCDYVIVNESKDPSEPILQYIGKPCPNCGNNLLTAEDYLLGEKVISIINFINRWFSWLTIFSFGEKKYKKGNLSINNGIKFEDDE